LTPTDRFLAELDAIIQEKHLLKHPFYQLWSEGKLSLESLRQYTRQYHQHVLRFPTYVSGAHSACPELGDRQQLLENLIEEEQGERNHQELWLRFGEALGLERSNIAGDEPLPETSALDAAFTRLCRRGSFVEAIAALYAYESMLPAVSESKIDGLKQFYGIVDRRGLEFFNVHKSIDVAHSQVTREMVGRYADDDGKQAAARAAVNEAVEALWGFLNGVQREYTTVPA